MTLSVIKYTMGVENIEVRGIAPGSIDGINYDINPSRQSTLREIGDNVLITRPLSQEFSGKKNDQEFKRRIEAVNLHQQEIPEYTLHKGYVVLQGYKDGDGNKEPVPVLGRFMEKITKIQRVTELPTENILSDVELCEALTTINAFQLKQLVFNSVLIDSGGTGNFGDKFPGIFRKFANHLTNDNVFVGFDKDGNRKIFCDPDWYVDIPNTTKDIKMKFLHSSRLAARTTFFFGATKLQQLKDKFGLGEKVGVRIQKDRVTKKERSYN